MKWLGKINFDNRPQYEAEGLITESEVDTISGSLNTKISAKPDTLLELSDTPSEYDNNKYLKSTTSGVEWATVSGGAGSSDHSELSSLAYADSGHTGFQPSGNYATDSELTTLSGSLQTNIDGKSDTGHTHTESDISDLDKYTEAEVDTISGSLNTKIDGKADIVHTHDDRYYTESEVDTISGSLQTNIDGKSDTGHTHVEANITDLDKYTQAEVDAKWTTWSGTIDHDTIVNTHNLTTDIDHDQLTNFSADEHFTKTSINHSDVNDDEATKHRVINDSAGDGATTELWSADKVFDELATKSDTGHSHTESDISDLDKYTQSEVDTISGTLSSEIDSDISTHTSNADAHHTESHTVVSHSDTTATGANLNELVDSGDTTLHKHDTLYYTEAEVDTISGSLNTKIDGKIANLSEDATPELGGQLVVGEYDIKLDALLSADGKYSGITRDGVLGATLVYGDLVYLNTTDQRWELADADAEATSGDVDLAIVLAAGNDGDTRLLLTDGYVREDDWDFTSYGQALYISVTAGDMTQTVVSGTGDIVRTVGKAGTTADQIRFKPSESWVELS